MMTVTSLGHPCAKVLEVLPKTALSHVLPFIHSLTYQLHNSCTPTCSSARSLSPFPCSPCHMWSTPKWSSSSCGRACMFCVECHVVLAALIVPCGSSEQRGRRKVCERMQGWQLGRESQSIWAVIYFVLFWLQQILKSNFICEVNVPLNFNYFLLLPALCLTKTAKGFVVVVVVF